jgi:hypothetical protein
MGEGVRAAVATGPRGFSNSRMALEGATACTKLAAMGWGERVQVRGWRRIAGDMSFERFYRYARSPILFVSVAIENP